MLYLGFIFLPSGVQHYTKARVGEPKGRGNMDDYMFREHVVGSKVVRENTSYVEILNYSVRIPSPFSAFAHIYAFLLQLGNVQKGGICCSKFRVDPWEKSFIHSISRPYWTRYARKKS